MRLHREAIAKLRFRPSNFPSLSGPAYAPICSKNLGCLQTPAKNYCLCRALCRYFFAAGDGRLAVRVTREKRRQAAALQNSLQREVNQRREKVRRDGAFSPSSVQVGGGL